jgi:hypothetical protein
MVQRGSRFKTAHTGWYLSAKAYGEACDEPLGHELEAEWLSRVVRRFETALYGALFRRQSKKRHPHAQQTFPACVTLNRSTRVIH